DRRPARRVEWTHYKLACPRTGPAGQAGRTAGPGANSVMTRFWRLTPLVALCSAVLLLVAAIVIVGLAERGYREQAIQAVEVNSRILARVMAAPLAFDDVSAVSNYLTALSAHPDIVVAVVYDIDGEIVDSYRRDDSEPLPEAVQPGTVDYGAGRVSVTVAV